jgi:hypothetical protein
LVDDTTPQLGGDLDLNSNDITGTGNINILGNVTAQNYIVSSSVTYMTTSHLSGSTSYGDTMDDIHSFTGSISLASGSLVVGDPYWGGDIISTGTNAKISGSATSTGSFGTLAIDGHAGIGTTSPQLGSGWNKVLHVHSPAGVGSHIRFTDTTSGETGESGLYIGQYGNDAYLINRESGFMTFRVNGTTDAMRIKSDGKIGIGTTDPDDKLHISSSDANFTI